MVSMISQYREKVIKYKEYIEKHFDSSSKEYEALKGIIRMINRGLKELEKGNFSDEKDYNFQVNSIEGLFTHLYKKIKEVE